MGMFDTKIILLQLSIPLILPSVITAARNFWLILHRWFNKATQKLPGGVKCSLILLQNDTVIIMAREKNK